MWEKKPGTESVVAARKLAVQQRHADDAFTIDMAAAIKAKGLDTSNTVFVDYAEMELRCCALAAKDMPVVKEAE